MFGSVLCFLFCNFNYGRPETLVEDSPVGSLGMKCCGFSIKRAKYCLTIVSLQNTTSSVKVKATPYFPLIVWLALIQGVAFWAGFVVALTEKKLRKLYLSTGGKR